MEGPSPPLGASSPPSDTGRDNDEEAAGQIPAEAAAAHDMSAQNADSVEVTTPQSPHADGTSRPGGSSLTERGTSPRKRGGAPPSTSTDTSPTKVAALTPRQDRPANRPSQPQANRGDRCLAHSLTDAFPCRRTHHAIYDGDYSADAATNEGILSDFQTYIDGGDASNGEEGDDKDMAELDMDMARQQASFARLAARLSTSAEEEDPQGEFVGKYDLDPKDFIGLSEAQRPGPPPDFDNTKVYRINDAPPFPKPEGYENKPWQLG